MGKDRQRARQGESAVQQQQLASGAPDLAHAGSMPETGVGSDLASGVAASGVAGAAAMAAEHADDAGTQHTPQQAKLEVHLLHMYCMFHQGACEQLRMAAGRAYSQETSIP